MYLVHTHKHQKNNFHFTMVLFSQLDDSKLWLLKNGCFTMAIDYTMIV